MEEDCINAQWRLWNYCRNGTLHDKTNEELVELLHESVEYFCESEIYGQHYKHFYVERNSNLTMLHYLEKIENANEKRQCLLSLASTLVL